MSDWVGCIIATIGLLDSELISEAACSNSLQKHNVDRFMAVATQDLWDQEGLLVQFACHIQIIATCNKAIFRVDAILAKNRVEKSLARAA
jgi:hypothetical protein